jgi:thymidylate synthase ThyX
MTAKIKIIDDQKPEDIAMLQALYSRSPASVDSHLEKVADVGSGSFMDRYYVGYGHRSIGDCGTTTIFIEGVTMLTAKAIQDWPLYSGQESSTRYMDFSKSEFNDPLGTSESGRILERWRTFYLEAGDAVRAHIRERYPQQAGEDDTTYERAVNARCFDTLRSFLPAGAATNLSWHTNLRQAADQLSWLLHHPDPSIAQVARTIWSQLKERYSHSFRDPKPEHAEYQAKVMENHHFFEKFSFEHKAIMSIRKPNGDLILNADFMEEDITLHDLELLQARPKGAPVPRHLATLGNIKSWFPLDFGSYRDLQRHRNGIIRMPLLTTRMGFNKWYLEELPEDLSEKAKDLIWNQKIAIDDLACTSFDRQNYIAMGFNVPCFVTQNLPAFIYRVELRSGKTVHPSLRRIVHAEIEEFRSDFPNIPLHVDLDPDSWTIRRGNQTIEDKV